MRTISMKLRFLNELAQNAKNTPVPTPITKKKSTSKFDMLKAEPTPVVTLSLDECNYAGMTDEEDEEMHFMGIDKDTPEHRKMLFSMRVLKKSDPSLYNAIRRLN